MTSFLYHGTPRYWMARDDTSWQDEGLPTTPWQVALVEGGHCIFKRHIATDPNATSLSTGQREKTHVVGWHKMFGKARQLPIWIHVHSTDKNDGDDSAGFHDMRLRSSQWHVWWTTCSSSSSDLHRSTWHLHQWKHDLKAWGLGGALGALGASIFQEITFLARCSHHASIWLCRCIGNRQVATQLGEASLHNVNGTCRADETQNSLEPPSLRSSKSTTPPLSFADEFVDWVKFSRTKIAPAEELGKPALFHRQEMLQNLKTL